MPAPIAPLRRPPLTLIETSPRLTRWMQQCLSPVTPIRTLQQVLASLAEHRDAAAFAGAALKRLQIDYALAATELEQVPPAGAVVVVANHPFGGIDGLIALHALLARRNDVRVLANGILARIPALAPHVLPIDPFGTRRAARANVRSVRQALRHLREGGLLLMFPAGEVSHYQPLRAAVSDGAWHAGAARIVQQAGAPVVPMHFAGCNSLGFQLGGLLHPRVRTVLLMRELLNKAGRCVEVRIGRPQSPARLRHFDDPAALAAHLRASTYLLGKDIAAPAPAERTVDPLRDAVDRDLLRREVAALPDGARLASMGACAVYLAHAAQIPHLMQEIGRLREQSFRAVGEGTGRCADIDLHDDFYEQLFVWDARAGAVAGGYRLGRCDELRARFGRRGLYLNSLFEFREPFFRLLGPSLELGRSFVAPDYQRAYAPLLLLWKGICEYVARHPRYARLIGPASLSSDYDAVSRALIVRALRAHCQDPVLGVLVKPRQPFAAQLSLGSLFGSGRRLPDLESLDALLAGRERDGKGLPVLLRQYLKLGARVLAFNVDAAFGHSIDCLITLDLRRVPPDQLRKYMSEDSAKRFAAFWARPGSGISQA